MSRFNRIEELQAEVKRIDSLPEPPDQELIEFARRIHPYYMEIGEREKIIEKIKELSK